MKKTLTRTNLARLFRLSTLVVAGILATGCAPTVKTVPLTIQSDPMGAYVLFQVQADRKDVRSYDWVYIGNTPLKTRRSVLKSELEDADAFIVRVMKEGYLDQEKAYTGQQMVSEAKSKGTVFWNPRLVPAN
jgi:hypothetical protein